MPKDNALPLSQPGAFTDLLTEVLRNGAQALLAQAVEAEAADFLAKYSGFETEDGRQRVVRHGHLPGRTVMTTARFEDFSLEGGIFSTTVRLQAP